MNTGKCATVATLWAFALLAGCASAPAPVAPDIPATLAVPAGERLSVIVEATGVQIYDCVAAKDAVAGNVWAFRAPEAQLRDQAGHAFGVHYAGPTWEANDGSKIVGIVKAKENAPASDAIPWLLLTTGATYGHGVLAPIRSIQRLNTVGGQPLTPGCSADQVGREMRVPYQAEYRFYVAGS